MVLKQQFKGVSMTSSNNGNNVSKLKRGVVLKNATLKEQRAFALAKQVEIAAWHLANGALLEEEVEAEVISFEEAEEIRCNIYDVESFRKSKRLSVSAN